MDPLPGVGSWVGICNPAPFPLESSLLFPLGNNPLPLPLPGVGASGIKGVGCHLGIVRVICVVIVDIYSFFYICAHQKYDHRILTHVYHFVSGHLTTVTDLNHKI